MFVDTSFHSQLVSMLSTVSPSTLDAVAEAVFQDLLDEVTLGIGFEMHR